MAVFDGGVFDVGVFDVAVNAAASGATLTATVTLVAGQATSSDGYAVGTTLTVIVSLIPGVAVGDVVVVPEPVAEDFGVGALPVRVFRVDARAPGALIVVWVSVIPGVVFATRAATVPRRALIRRVELLPGDAAGEGLAPATMFLGKATLASGTASGFDAIKHDNEFLLMAA